MFLFQLFQKDLCCLHFFLSYTLVFILKTHSGWTLKFSLIKIIIAALHRSLPTLRILPYSTSAYIGYNELRKQEFLYSYAQGFFFYTATKQNILLSADPRCSSLKSLPACRKSSMLHFICQKSYILKDYKLLIYKIDSESLKIKWQPFCLAVTFKVYLDWKLAVFFQNENINSHCYSCCLPLKWLYHSNKIDPKVQECFT